MQKIGQLVGCDDPALVSDEELNTTITTVQDPSFRFHQAMQGALAKLLLATAEKARLLRILHAGASQRADAIKPPPEFVVQPIGGDIDSSTNLRFGMSTVERANWLCFV